MATATVKNLATGGSSGVLATDRREHHIDPFSFSELFKNETPFLWLAMKNRRQISGDPVFKMFQYENTFMRRYIRNNGSTVTIAAASAGAATESDAVTIDGVTGFGSTSTIDASFVHKQFEVWDSTLTTNKGVVLLTDDVSTTTAKFKNLGTTAISTVDNDYYILISNAQEDGTEAPDAYASELSVVYNQCQQFWTPVQLEGEILYAALRGDNNEFQRLVAEKGKEHKVEMEGAFMKGKSPLGTNLGGADTFSYKDLLTGDNGKVVRTTYGLIPALDNYGSSTSTDQYRNLWDVTEASFTYDEYVDMTEKMFQYYPPNNELYAVAGPGAVSFWSKLTYARSPKANWTVQFSPQQTDTFGINIRKLETPHGILNITKSDALKFEYNKYMLVIDDRYVSFNEYRPTVYKTNIKTENAYDGRKDVYFSDAGLGLTHIKTHARVKIV